MARRWVCSFREAVVGSLSEAMTAVSSALVAIFRKHSASHPRVAPQNVGLQKEQKYNTFVCHTCNEVRLCVLGIRKKEVGNTKR
jgi:hypothetical protein